MALHNDLLDGFLVLNAKIRSYQPSVNLINSLFRRLINARVNQVLFLSLFLTRLMDE